MNEDIQRSQARCPHFGTCGGCRTQDIPYRLQLERKQSDLRELLAPAVPPDLLESMDVHPSPILWEYRNRMEFTFSAHDDRLALGLHRMRRYWDLIDLEECHLCPIEFSRILSAVREFARDLGLPAYHKNRHDGFWRYLLIRGTCTARQFLADVMTAEENPQVITALAEHLTQSCPELSALYWSHVPGVADVAAPIRSERIFGQPCITERFLGLEVPIYSRTFMQPNLTVAEAIYETLADALDLSGQEKVLDLYCGMGLIGGSLSDRAGEVLGIEIEPVNIETAREFIRRNGLGNVRVLQSDVALLQRPPFDLREKDVIILDPPRAGLSKQVFAFLEACPPCRIAYLSCNPKALADNLARFADAGRYRPFFLKAFDMFPHTPHVETLTLLEPVMSR
ncbi:MAG TPA: 23S rRNA (uracil(1939)-C(5))-methyltransferase RlmD [bacterium]|nr:23S rRNA (uracil(1939)-C(5))-methyltransferase RlmD [bacterium]